MTRRDMEILLDEIMLERGFQVEKTVFLKEYPNSWKHSCFSTGIVVLDEESLPLDLYTSLMYAFCPACGTLYYFYQF